jgi:hypothetical protein
VAVYKLSPISGTQSALAWHQSYCTEICWVNADTEVEARKAATMATAKVRVPGASGEEPVGWPWENHSLSLCILDNSGVSVPPGKVLGKSGRLYGD